VKAQEAAEGCAEYERPQKYRQYHLITFVIDDFVNRALDDFFNRARDEFRQSRARRISPIACRGGPPRRPAPRPSGRASRRLLVPSRPGSPSPTRPKTVVPRRIGPRPWSVRVCAPIRFPSTPTASTTSVRFHYRQGGERARGCYEDAYDFESVRDFILGPLGSQRIKGSSRFGCTDGSDQRFHHRVTG
jgi:hypothetical protein